MCGLLPCEFWRLVVVHPHESLAFALVVGFLGGLLVVAIVQSRPVARLLDRLHRLVTRVPECGPEGCYCRRTCLWMLDIDPASVARHG